MKILLIAPFSVVHSRRYFDLIRRGGCEVVLVNSGRSGPFAGINKYYQWPAEKFWTRNAERLVRHLVGKRAGSKVSEFLTALELRWIWAITRSDIAHVQWIDDRAWLVAKAGLSPLVLTVWGSDLNLTQQGDHDLTLLQQKVEAISKAALVIADSQSMVGIANNLTNSGVPSLVLPIGIDTKTLFTPGYKGEARDWRRELGIPESAKVVLSPRAFRRNYGHHDIVQAFGRAIVKNNIDAYLILKTYDAWEGEYAGQVWSIANGCGIQDRVRIVGEVPYRRLPVFYAMGDFAVNFPIMDAFPVTFIECLSCELPVLTKRLASYDTRGISTYLHFTDAPTVDSLEESFKSMLTCANARQDMQRVRAYVCEQFDESVVANSLVDAYRNTLRGARSTTPAPH